MVSRYDLPQLFPKAEEVDSHKIPTEMPTYIDPKSVPASSSASHPSTIQPKFDFTVDEKLTRGDQGTMDVVKHTSSGELFVLKTMRKPVLLDSKPLEGMHLESLRVHSHPNIIHYTLGTTKSLKLRCPNSTSKSPLRNYTSSITPWVNYPLLFKAIGGTIPLYLKVSYGKSSHKWPPYLLFCTKASNPSYRLQKPSKLPRSCTGISNLQISFSVTQPLIQYRVIPMQF